MCKSGLRWGGLLSNRFEVGLFVVRKHQKTVSFGMGAAEDRIKHARDFIAKSEQLKKLEMGEAERKKTARRKKK